MKSVAVVTGSRANYGSIKSALLAISRHPELDLHLILAASAILDRYGDLRPIVKEDGLPISETINFLIEGETPVTMAKSTGLGLIELAGAFERISPDLVLTVGDRFETMATTLAAAYLNIPIAHTMGGEISGNIDDRVRHAVTKFAQLHFPATRSARDRILGLGEAEEMVHCVGCPRIDLAAQVLRNRKTTDLTPVMKEGVGDVFDLNEDFVLLVQHPITSEYGEGEDQIRQSLLAIRDVGLPALVLWPNADAGSEDVSRGLRKWRELEQAGPPMRFIKNLRAEPFLGLLARTSCLVGNSSSGIREGAFIGTPCVNIGTRQQGRERATNVLDVGYARAQIASAVGSQAAHGQFPSSPLYGTGNAGEQIANIIASIEHLDTNKTMAF